MAGSYNFYELLGVSTTASLEEISVAYRRNVAKYHPDINAAPNAQVLLTMLNEAWETLRDPVRRADYDRTMRSSASSSRESQSAGESAAQRGEAQRREQAVKQAQRRAAESERIARVERQKRLILERAVEDRKRNHPFLGIIVVAFLLFGLAVILVLIRAPLPNLVTAPATSAAQVECADLTISDVTDYGAIVSTSDGRSYTVADQGLMRIYVRNWSRGDNVTVCRSGTSASIANAAQSTKVQARER
jgi:hypothetical protein